MSELLTRIQAWLTETAQSIAAWTTTASFYLQCAAVLVVIAIAFALAALLRNSVAIFKEAPDGTSLPRLRGAAYKLRALLFPVFNIALLGIAIGLAEANASDSWVLRIAQGLAVVFLMYSVIRQYIDSPFIRFIAKWLGIPMAVLHVFDWLSPVTHYLQSISLSVGDIHISVLALTRTLLFGALLFWLGRLSNTTGKNIIRNHPALSTSSREVFAKLFEIALFVVIFLLLLQIMGINLTALAVFGGALGVGLGFGLQQIASNFVSGIIILLDRSVAIGDHIELEDGRSGVLRELNMRFGVIETFDGKDIVVPNEAFVTTSYTNWTHKDPNQRYSLKFQVAYSTDLDLLFDNIRALCAEHPQVLSGDDLAVEMKPDAEIAGFGDSGIDILVEFWMEGVDDGPNRVGADLMHSIWRSIQEHGMEIPFPQREVRIIGGDSSKDD